MGSEAAPGGATSGKLAAKVFPAADLDPATVGAMWRLFERYYERASRSRFEADLAKKEDVIVLFDTGDRSVQGFSTLTLCRDVVDGRKLLAVFSGDTIIDSAYWGQSALQVTFYRYVLTKKLENPLADVYWFLISKGYRTYLLLTRNYLVHWPRHDRPTPAHETRVIDALARRLYPSAWIPELGIVRPGADGDVLREGIAPIDPSMLKFPDIAFFAERNPGHVNGDELCCLGLVDAKALAWFVLRAAGKTMTKLVSPSRSRPLARAEPISEREPPASRTIATMEREEDRSRTG